MSDPAAQSEKGRADLLPISVLSGAPTATELAAIRAVLDHAVEERAAEQARLADDGPSAWEQSQRPIRTPVRSGRGNWRGYSG